MTPPIPLARDGLANPPADVAEPVVRLALGDDTPPTPLTPVELLLLLLLVERLGLTDKAANELELPTLPLPLVRPPVVVELLEPSELSGLLNEPVLAVAVAVEAAEAVRLAGLEGAEDTAEEDELVPLAVAPSEPLAPRVRLAPAPTVLDGDMGVTPPARSYTLVSSLSVVLMVWAI